MRWREALGCSGEEVTLRVISQTELAESCALMGSVDVVALAVSFQDVMNARYRDLVASLPRRPLVQTSICRALTADRV